MRTLYLDSLRILAHYRTLKASSDESYKILGISFSYNFSPTSTPSAKGEIAKEVSRAYSMKKCKIHGDGGWACVANPWVSRVAQG